MMTKVKKQIQEMKELLDTAEMKLKNLEGIKECYRKQLDAVSAENKLLKDRERHLQAEVSFYRDTLIRALRPASRNE